jgi:hypothetical protein
MTTTNLASRVEAATGADRVKLTEAQRRMLRLAERSNWRVYVSPNDRCLVAMARKGLAEFNRNYSRYGRDVWRITDAGRSALRAMGADHD